MPTGTEQSDEFVMSIGFEEGNVISINGNRGDFIRLKKALADADETGMILDSIDSFVSLIDKEGETLQ